MSESIPAPIQAAFEQERESASRCVPLARDAAGHRKLTLRMYGRLAELQQTVIENERVEVACRQGCAFCCSQRVEVRAYEAFALAHHIQTRFDVRKQAAVKAALDSTLEQIEPLTREQHVRAGIGCALLVEGACSVYEARPAACRKYYSVSVETCRAAAENPAAPLQGPLEHDNLRFAGNAVALGFAKGVEDAGFNSDLYELHRALRSALEGNKSDKRYRDRKKPFI